MKNALSADSIEFVLRNELRWHKDHEGSSGQSPDWELGFLEGIRHSLKLTRKINSSYRRDKVVCGKCYKNPCQCGLNPLPDSLKP